MSRLPAHLWRIETVHHDMAVLLIGFQQNRREVWVVHSVRKALRYEPIQAIIFDSNLQEGRIRSHLGLEAEPGVVLVCDAVLASCPLEKIPGCRERNSRLSKKG